MNRRTLVVKYRRPKGVIYAYSIHCVCHKHSACVCPWLCDCPCHSLAQLELSEEQMGRVKAAFDSGSYAPPPHGMMRPT